MCADQATGPRRGMAFSAMSEEKASKFALGLKKAAELGATAVVLLGAWRHRRFVIAAGRPSYEKIVTAQSDASALTLTLPIPTDARSIVTECRRFGGQIEHVFRQGHRGFEVVACERDLLHIVARYHHVALCKSKGPWPDASPAVPEQDLDECPACASISRTKPAYAARFHPLADSVRSSSAESGTQEGCERTGEGTDANQGSTPVANLALAGADRIR